MRIVVLVLLSSAAVACKGKPAFSDDYFVGRTVRFTPDEPLGGIDEWYYDLDIQMVRQEGSGVVRVDGVQGCNVEQRYEATGWSFDNETDSITVEFGGEWEKYTLVEVNDLDLPTRGRFEYDSSVGVQMEGEWNLGLQLEAACVMSSPSSVTSSEAYCDCLHCTLSGCTNEFSETQTCCSDASFIAE